jgi:hypothetical protein
MFEKLHLDLVQKKEAPKMKRQLLALINPFAGLGRAKTIWIEDIQPRLLEAGWEEEDLQVRVTTGPGHVRSLLTERADKAIEEGQWTIMVLGGMVIRYVSIWNANTKLMDPFVHRRRTGA